jgi:hypothetical protein
MLGWIHAKCGIEGVVGGCAGFPYTRFMKAVLKAEAKYLLFCEGWHNGWSLPDLSKESGIWRVNNSLAEGILLKNHFASDTLSCTEILSCSSNIVLFSSYKLACPKLGFHPSPSSPNHLLLNSQGAPKDTLPIAHKSDNLVLHFNQAGICCY